MIDFKLSANEYSPLVLAYVGDAVYELYIRSRLIKSANIPPAALHKTSTGFVCAEAQFKAFHLIEDKLSEEELTVLKRGRNAKSYTTPKHADVTHYRYATGIEALIGYLYINGEQSRVDELMEMIFTALRDESDEKKDA